MSRRADSRMERPFPCRRGPACAVVVAALATVAAEAPRAQELDAKLWVTDGPVHAIAPAGEVVYLGGAFGYVGPPTGSLVRVDAASGALREGLPVVVGDVAALVPDGDGGWFLGGRFSRVGGEPRRNLAHVQGDGAVSGWDPGADGEVTALALSGSALYVGGAFTRVAGKERGALAAVDAKSGAPLEWNPAPEGTLDGGVSPAIHALVADGDRVLVGGSFERIGGQPRRGLAAVDGARGGALAWGAGANRPVRALVHIGGRLFAGGEFDSLGGARRMRLGAVDAVSGALLPWNADANGRVLALAGDGATLYAGGSFVTVAGAFRPGLAALDPATGAVGAWNPAPSGEVGVIAVSGSIVRVGGEFTAIAGVVRLRAAALSRTNGQALPWDPAFSAAPRAIASDPAGVVVAGRFRSAGGLDRRALVALDAETGAPTGWNPGANGPVYSILPSGLDLFVGGGFSTIGERRRSRLAKLDAETGTVRGWDPGASGAVRAMALAGGRLLVGGDFIRLGPFERLRLGAVDPNTGVVSPWDPLANAPVEAIEVDGPIVYVGGRFGFLNHEYRPRVAALSLVTGLPTDWFPQANGTVHDILVSSGIVYIGGEFSQVGGEPRTLLAAIDPATGEPTDWDPGAGSELPAPAVHALALRGDVAFLGGNFTQVGGLERSLLAAVRVKSGGVWDWNPDGHAAPGLAVRELALDGPWLYAAGSFTDLGGGPQQGIARFRVDALEGIEALEAPGAPPPGNRVLRGVGPNPFGGTARIAFSLPRAGRLDVRVFDLQGREVAAPARGAWREAGPGTLAWSAGALPAGVYVLALDFEGRRETRRIVRLR